MQCASSSPPSSPTLPIPDGSYGKTVRRGMIIVAAPVHRKSSSMLPPPARPMNLCLCFVFLFRRPFSQRQIVLQSSILCNFLAPTHRLFTHCAFAVPEWNNPKRSAFACYFAINQASPLQWFWSAICGVECMGKIRKSTRQVCSRPSVRKPVAIGCVLGHHGYQLLVQTLDLGNTLGAKEG